MFVVAGSILGLAANVNDVILRPYPLRMAISTLASGVIWVYAMTVAALAFLYASKTYWVVLLFVVPVLWLMTGAVVVGTDLGWPPKGVSSWLSVSAWASYLVTSLCLVAPKSVSLFYRAYVQYMQGRSSKANRVA